LIAQIQQIAESPKRHWDEIEVDGRSHQFTEVILKDERKQALESAGFTLLRFNDEEVLKNMRGVIAYLEDWIEKTELAAKPK